MIKFEKSNFINIKDLLPTYNKNVLIKSLCGFCVAYYDGVWKGSYTHKPLTGFSKPIEWKNMPRVIIN